MAEAIGRATGLVRLAAIVGSAAVLVAGCSTHDAVRVMSTSAPAPAVSADALVLPLQQVQTIVGNDVQLSADPTFDLHSPYTGMHDNDAIYPAPCRVIFDQDAVFNPGWTQFRTAKYSGSANRTVTQAVGIYPTPDAAKAVFTTMASQLSGCADAHVADFAFTVGHPDDSTVARCSDGVCNHLVRVKGSTLVSVDTVHLGNEQQVANAVLDAITIKVPA